MNIGDALAANLRSARARRQLSQAEIGERMRDLGFTAWIRQTMSGVEKGRRRLTAEEVFGLAQVLDTTVASLMQMSANGTVFFPNGNDTISDDIFA